MLEVTWFWMCYLCSVPTNMYKLGFFCCTVETQRSREDCGQIPYCKIINHNSNFLLDIVQFESYSRDSCHKGFTENVPGTEYR